MEQNQPEKPFAILKNLDNNKKIISHRDVLGSQIWSNMFMSNAKGHSVLSEFHLDHFKHAVFMTMKIAEKGIEIVTLKGVSEMDLLSSPCIPNTLEAFFPTNPYTDTYITGYIVVEVEELLKIRFPGTDSTLANIIKQINAKHCAKCIFKNFMDYSDMNLDVNDGSADLTSCQCFIHAEKLMQDLFSANCVVSIDELNKLKRNILTMMLCLKEVKKKPIKFYENLAAIEKEEAQQNSLYNNLRMIIRRIFWPKQKYGMYGTFEEMEACTWTEGSFVFREMAAEEFWEDKYHDVENIITMLLCAKNCNWKSIQLKRLENQEILEQVSQAKPSLELYKYSRQLFRGIIWNTMFPFGTITNYYKKELIFTSDLDVVLGYFEVTNPPETAVIPIAKISDNGQVGSIDPYVFAQVLEKEKEDATNLVSRVMFHSEGSGIMEDASFYENQYKGSSQEIQELAQIVEKFDAKRLDITGKLFDQYIGVFGTTVLAKSGELKRLREQDDDAVYVVDISAFQQPPKKGAKRRKIVFVDASNGKDLLDQAKN